MVQAQDPVFTQFFAAPMHLNPAFAGISYFPNITVGYRNEWPTLPNAYITYQLSYEQTLATLNSGVGLTVVSDAEGDGIYKSTHIGANYAYNAQINDALAIKLGLGAGYGQKRLDWSKTLFWDQLDEMNGNVGTPTMEDAPERSTRSYLDLSAGMLVVTPYVYGGLSARHLNAPDLQLLTTDASGVDTDGKLPVALHMQLGGQIPLNDKKPDDERFSFVSPNILVARQRDQYQVSVGAYAKAWLLYGGAWYRHTFTNQDAVAVLGGVQKGMFKLGYSYDFTLSELAGKTGGAHEIMLGVNFDRSEMLKRKKNSRMLNDCFKIFR